MKRLGGGEGKGYVINVARGSVVDEEALVKCLKVFFILFYFILFFILSIFYNFFFQII